jgi:hypothetical protein
MNHKYIAVAALASISGSWAIYGCTATSTTGNSPAAGPLAPASCPTSQENRDRHPQSPSYLGKEFELLKISYFKGNVVNGQIYGVTATPSKVTDDKDNEYAITQAADDPCAKSGTTLKPIVPTLPLYTIKGVKANKQYGDMCDVDYPFTETGDIAKCSESEHQLLQGKAIAINGVWNQNTGEFTTSTNQFTLACIDGAAAKCVHWGYVPWATYNKKPLEPYYTACVLAARAAYVSTDFHTCQDTPIDIYDDLGIELVKRDDAGVPDRSWTFEAAWKADGGVCAERARFEFPPVECLAKVPFPVSDAGDCAAQCPPDQLDGGWGSGVRVCTRVDPKRTALGTHYNCPSKSTETNGVSACDP